VPEPLRQWEMRSRNSGASAFRGTSRVRAISDDAGDDIFARHGSHVEDDTDRAVAFDDHSRTPRRVRFQHHGRALRAPLPA